MPLRVRDFEERNELQDPNFNKPPQGTYAKQLRDRILAITGIPPASRSQPSIPDRPSSASSSRPQPRSSLAPESATVDTSSEQVDADDELVGMDVLRTIQTNAINALRDDPLCDRIRADGRPWGGIKAFFLKQLPKDLDDRDDFAYQLVSQALTEIFGPQGQGWESFKNKDTGKLWVRAINEQ